MKPAPVIFDFAGSCTNIEFALKLKFRLPIFTLICALLLTMCLLYVAVILVLHKSRQKFAPAAIAATAKRVADLSTTVTVNSSRTPMDKNCRLSIENDNRQNGVVSRANSLRTRKHQQQLQRKRNTLLTTLLIWSTFFVAWFPVATIYVLSCDTCVFSPHKRYHFKAVFTVSTVAQFGILTKTLINPIIYAVRIPEIRGVLVDFWTSCRRRGGAGPFSTTTTPAAKNRRRFDVEANDAASIILAVGGDGGDDARPSKITSKKVQMSKKDRKVNGTGFCSDDDLDS
uniref:G-protein coupled receptors family 1 profile domain-containing protein n=1 Tax=Romanomermis culicivorax TaxID=13658 RepID=A0A915KMN7_ROMCU